MRNVEYIIVGSFINGCELREINHVAIDEHGCGYCYDGLLPHNADADSMINDGFGAGRWILAFGETPVVNASCVPYIICLFMIIVMVIKLG